MSETSPIKARIGDLGLPTEVWVVRTLGRIPIDTVCFFDKAKALAWVAEEPVNRHLKPTPIKVLDAG